MPLKRTINTLHKNHVKSIKENLEWFNTQVDDKNSLAVYNVPANKYLKAGKIYRFYYRPITINKLSFYDTNPLVISLGKVKFKTNIVDLCLNLNLFPYTTKVHIINEIYKAYKNIINTQVKKHPLNAKLQKEYDLTYEVLQDLFSKYNISFGIRNYLKEKRSKTRTISYDNYFRVPFIEDYKFSKKGVKHIHNLYYKSLKKK